MADSSRQAANSSPVMGTEGSQHKRRNRWSPSNLPTIRTPSIKKKANTTPPSSGSLQSRPPPGPHIPHRHSNSSSSTLSQASHLRVSTASLSTQTPSAQPSPAANPRIVTTSLPSRPNPITRNSQTIRPSPLQQSTLPEPAAPPEVESSAPTPVRKRRRVVKALARFGRSIINPKRIKKLFKKQSKQHMPTPAPKNKANRLSLRAIFTSPKPEISISFSSASDNEPNHDGSPKVYSTLDAIEGTVTIVAPANMHFDALEIALTGVSKTTVDKLRQNSTVAGRSEATHRFLKLVQPILPEAYPESMILESGKTYKFPFMFVIPENLLPKACSHRLASEQVHELHLKLPPSLNDKGVSDHAPENARIGYAVEARIMKQKSPTKKIVLCQHHEMIRIRPTTEEFPPLDVDGDQTYLLRREKVVKKGIRQTSMGTLVMEAEQPASFRLPAMSQDQKASTYVTLHMRFDPEHEIVAPPQPSTLVSKLKVSTFFASTCRADFPKRLSEAHDLSSDFIHESFSLSNFRMPPVKWIYHTRVRSANKQNANGRPPSVLSTISTISGTSCGDEIIAPSSTYHNGTFYTASILVPISLPNDKYFLPTFHSCLISRVYGLSLSMNFVGLRFASPLTLKLPVQVSTAGSSAGAERQRLNRAAEEATQDAETALEPRPVLPTSERVSRDYFDGWVARLDTNGDRPPAYGGVPGPAGVTRVSVYA